MIEVSSMVYTTNKCLDLTLQRVIGIHRPDPYFPEKIDKKDDKEL